MASASPTPVPSCVALARRQRVERAFAELLRALGQAPEGPLLDTPRRAAALWTDHLLAGEDRDLGALLGSGHPTTATSPISVNDVGVHLLCSHHLTVAFGRAHVAYLPAGRVVGFTALAHLIEACTARFILHEEASQSICNALQAHLGVAAVVACIEAVHPCHNVMHPRSHAARAVGWAQRGPARATRELRQLLLAARRPQ